MSEIDFGNLFSNGFETEAEAETEFKNEAHPNEQQEIIDVENINKIEVKDNQDVEKLSVNESEAKMSISTSITQNRVEIEKSEKEETLAIVDFGPNPASVSLKKGITINMGAFESFRVDVSVSTPCHPNDVKKLVMTAGGVIDQRLAKEVSIVRQKYRTDANSVFNGGY